jgi:hypothetical protein
MYLMLSRQRKMAATTGTSGGVIVRIGGRVMEVPVSLVTMDFRLTQVFDIRYAVL